MPDDLPDDVTDDDRRGAVDPHAGEREPDGGGLVIPDLVTGSAMPAEPGAAEGASQAPGAEDGGDMAGLLGGLDLGALLDAAGQMQTQIAAAQQQAAEQEIEAVAGGGAVRITLTGSGEFRRVQIAPEAVDPADVDLLCDLVLAALHDATAKVQELQSSSMGGLGDLLGGGGLGGLLGDA